LIQENFNKAGIWILLGVDSGGGTGVDVQNRGQRGLTEESEEGNR